MADDWRDLPWQAQNLSLNRVSDAIGSALYESKLQTVEKADGVFRARSASGCQFTLFIEFNRQKYRMAAEDRSEPLCPQENLLLGLDYQISRAIVNSAAIPMH